MGRYNLHDFSELSGFSAASIAEPPEDLPLGTRKGMWFMHDGPFVTLPNPLAGISTIPTPIGGLDVEDPLNGLHSPCSPNSSL